MRKDSKAMRDQFASQRFGYEDVVECAAAQADLIERRFLAQQAREAHESFDESVVESAADYLHAHISAEILDDGAEERSGVDQPMPVLAANGEGIAAGLAR